MADNQFNVLKRKEIYAILDGDKRDLYTDEDEKGYGLPYMTANNLDTLCTDFGVTGVAGSRWTYVEAVLDKAIEDNRCNDLLHFFFDRSRFTHLNSFDSMDTIIQVHKAICTAAIDAINHELRLGGKKLLYCEGYFSVVDQGQNTPIETPNLNICTIDYVLGLKSRCEANLSAGNYDSVVTKSRTMLEELLVKILEDNGQPKDTSGDLIKLYNLVKNLYGMRQTGNYDQRVNSLLNGLEKIVQAIAELRNTNSDAHGAGSSRVQIKEREARLIMNSSMVLCEYLLTIHNEKMAVANSAVV